MRFTTIHLLLVFPAFFLGTLVAFVLANSSPPSSVVYTHDVARGGVRDVEITIEILEQEHGIRIDADTLNAWLADELPSTSPLCAQWGYHFECDPWGKPYRVVRDLKLDGGQTVPLAVYSTGQDGVSRTQGNDADDVNNSDMHSLAYYNREKRKRDREEVAYYGALLTPLTYAALLGWLRFRRRRRAKAQEPPATTASPLAD